MNLAFIAGNLARLASTHFPHVMLPCNDDADAGKSGVTAETVAAGLKSGQLTVQEAQQILGVEKNATLDQVRKVRAVNSGRHRAGEKVQCACCRCCATGLISFAPAHGAGCQSSNQTERSTQSTCEQSIPVSLCMR